MTQITDDCFAFGGPLMPVDEARQQIDQVTPSVVTPVMVSLDQVLGRVLAADIVAQVSSPPRDNAAVDGYAFAGSPDVKAAGARLTVVGQAAAGHGLTTEIAAGEAARIFTGAPMPAGTDTVVMQEDVTLSDDGAVVAIPAGLSPGANCRKAGEDFAAGQVLRNAGQVVSPADVALMAAGGATAVSVLRALKIAILSTGDEIRPAGSALQPGQIYDANRPLIAALAKAAGAEIVDHGIVPDTLEATKHALAAAAEDADLVITSGGVSTGDADHVKPAVEALGALHLWRIAVKPGRPLAFGHVGGTAFVGLPGNPVASMVCFLMLVRPLIARLGGAPSWRPRPVRVQLDFDHKSKPDRREWLRGSIAPAPDGRGMIARKYPRQGSGIIHSIADSDGLIEIPDQCTRLSAGDFVDFLPFQECFS